MYTKFYFLLAKTKNQMKQISKKIIVATILTIILGVGFARWHIASGLNKDVLCAFCNPQVLKTHTFYEDSLVQGLCSYKPVKPGHCLAITKRHVEKFDELSDEEFSAIGKLIKKINLAIQKINGSSEYIILQKNGKGVGQSVPHVHFHYIPQNKTNHDDFSTINIWWNFIISFFRKKLTQEELSSWVNKIHQEI